VHTIKHPYSELKQFRIPVSAQLAGTAEQSWGHDEDTEFVVDHARSTVADWFDRARLGLTRSGWVETEPQDYDGYEPYAATIRRIEGSENERWEALKEAVTTEFDSLMASWSAEPALLVTKPERATSDLAPFRAGADETFLVPHWLTRFNMGAMPAGLPRWGVERVGPALELFESQAHMEAFLTLWEPAHPQGGLPRAASASLSASSDYDHVWEVAQAL
jgi:hypothetical protein